MVSINQVATGDVVKPASVVETMASAALGGVANSVVSSMFPGYQSRFSPLIGMIVGGVVAGSIVPGKAGDIRPERSYYYGGREAFGRAMQAFGAMFGGNASRRTG